MEKFKKFAVKLEFVCEKYNFSDYQSKEMRLLVEDCQVRFYDETLPFLTEKNQKIQYEALESQLYEKDHPLSLEALFPLTQ
jgi:hypothetical protein